MMKWLFFFGVIATWEMSFSVKQHGSSEADIRRASMGLAATTRPAAKRLTGIMDDCPADRNPYKSDWFVRIIYPVIRH